MVGPWIRRTSSSSGIRADRDPPRRTVSAVPSPPSGSVPALLAALLLLLAGSWVPAAPAAAQSPEVFEPHRVLEPSWGPPIHIYRTGADQVVTLRVSAPFVEGWGDAGAGQVLARMSSERMEAIGNRIGARSSATRTATAIVYEVTGPAPDLDFLVWVLRAGLEEPDAGSFQRLRRDALSRVDRVLETPEGALALDLRRSIDPDAPPLQGTLPALERLTAQRLVEHWSATHRLDALRIVTVGNVEAEVLLASLSELGVPGGEAPGISPSAASGGEVRAEPEVIRRWEARAWALDEGRDPATLVAARILTELHRDDPGDYELGVELWELGRSWTLVVSGAAYPRGLSAMQDRLGSLAATAADRVTEEQVARHAARIRAELLEQARTPWGLAEMVGLALDAGEGPHRMARVMDDLDALDASRVRDFLLELRDRTPVTATVLP